MALELQIAMLVLGAITLEPITIMPLAAPTRTRASRSRHHRGADVATDDAVGTIFEKDVILENILSSLSGQGIFVNSVAKRWRKIYERASVRRDGNALTFAKTEYKEAFISPARLEVAHSYGLSMGHSEPLVQRIAGKVASVHTLFKAYKLGMHWSDEMMRGAAESGCLAKLKWLYANRSCSGSSVVPSGLDGVAAQYGGVEMLKWLKHIDAPLSAAAFDAAAAGGNIPALDYLHGIVKCDLQNVKTDEANSDVLQWLIEHGALDSLLQRRVAAGHAARRGDLETVKWMQTQTTYGITLVANTMLQAVRGGYLDVCEYLRKFGCPIMAQGCFSAAAVEGFTHVIDWLIQSGAVMPLSDVVYSAVKNDRTNVIEHLQQHGHEMSYTVCDAASECGAFNMLKWAVENDHPVDDEYVAVQCAQSCNNDNEVLQMLKWLEDNGIEWGVGTSTEILNACGQKKMLNTAIYIRTLGAEWPAQFINDPEDIEEHDTEEGLNWDKSMILWAYSEACTSPWHDVDEDGEDTIGDAVVGYVFS